MKKNDFRNARSLFEINYDHIPATDKTSPETIISQYRYIKKNFHDPYKIIGAAEKTIDWLFTQLLWERSQTKKRIKNS